MVAGLDCAQLYEMQSQQVVLPAGPGTPTLALLPDQERSKADIHIFVQMYLCLTAIVI